jgi:hypothetical protein
MCATLASILESSQNATGYICDSTLFSRRLHLHKLEHIADHLRKSQDGLSTQEVAQILASIEGLTQAPDEVEIPSQPITCVALVSRAITLDKVLDKVSYRDDSESWDAVVEKDVAIAFMMAFREILNDAIREATLAHFSDPIEIRKSKNPTVELYASTRQLGSSKFVRIGIQSPRRHAMSERLAQLLYHLPIKGDDRWHIGSYSAATIMRQVGGDIVLDKWGKIMRTSIWVPTN